MALDGLVVVRTCASAFEAELLATRLRSAGIDATLEQELAGLPYGRRGARVLVLEADVAAAVAEVGADPEPPVVARTFGLRRLSRAQLEAVLAEQASLPWTYDADLRGASLRDLPSGFAHVHRSAVLTGPDAFARGRAAVERWAAHARAAIELVPARPPITVDQSILQHIRLGPLHVLACCRVVEVVDEADRFGFAYGTLPLHPESGEEAFLVVRDGDTVRFEVRAFSRPSHVLSRLGGPVTSGVQSRVIDRYVRGIVDAL